jgi:hypothetical protein
VKSAPAADHAETLPPSGICVRATHRVPLKVNKVIVKLYRDWRGGRVVDGSGLENRHTRKGIGGSNPSLSASTFVIWHLRVGDTYTDTTGQDTPESGTDQHPQTARPRHTPARPGPNPQLKKKLSEHPSTGESTCLPDRNRWSPRIAQDRQQQVLCEAVRLPVAPDQFRIPVILCRRFARLRAEVPV